MSGENNMNPSRRVWMDDSSIPQLNCLAEFNGVRVFHETQSNSILMSINDHERLHSQTECGNNASMYHSHQLGLMLATAMTELPTVLCVGVGGGSLVTQCIQLYGEDAVVGVESNSDVLRLAVDHMSFKHEHRVIVQDIRQINLHNTYSVIMLDIDSFYRNDSTLYSPDFYRTLRKHMAYNAVLAVNVSEQSTADLIQHMRNIHTYLGHDYARALLPTGAPGHQVLYMIPRAMNARDFHRRVLRLESRSQIEYQPLIQPLLDRL